MPAKTHCIFGQEFENAEVYNFVHAEILHGNKSNVTNYVEYNRFKVSSLTLSNSYDFENFCKLFDISENTLINTCANNNTKIDNLWKFIFDNVHRPCFCISVFDKSFKTDISSEQTLSPEETQILEFHFGRHFFILVPVEKVQKPVQKYGGEWKTAASMNAALQSFGTESKKKTAIIDNLRYHKLVLKTQPSKSKLFTISANGKPKTLDVLKDNLRALITLAQEMSSEESDDDNEY